MLTLLLEALDQTVVGTAMPRIIGKLHGFDRYAWAVSAYLLASTIMISIAGKLSDQFGRKWFLLIGTTIFLLGSALCGASQTINQLILFRAVQGLGAGIGISLVFASVADIFPPEQRARWQGVLGSVYGLSSVIGPTLGGWLADHGPLLGALVTEDSRWRWVFYVNLPVGTIALAALLTYLPTDISVRSSDHTGWAMLRRVDGLGAALVAAASICLLVGLTLVGDGTDTWGSPRVEATLAAAGLLYAAFVLAERSALEPVLSPALFCNRVFAAAAGLTLFLWMALFGMAFYVPLFLQGVLGASPTMAGATMTPFSVSIVIGSSLAGMVISFLRRYQAVAIGGTLLMATGVALLSQMTPATGLLQVAAFAVTAGLGMGILFTATAVVVQTVLPPTHLGAGFGAVRYLGQVGGILGVALVGTVVNGSLLADVHRRLPPSVLNHLASEGVRFAAGPQVLVSPTYRATVVRTALRRTIAHVPPGPLHHHMAVAATRQELHLLDRVFEALRLSLAVAIRHGLVAALVFCGVAALAALFVRDVPIGRTGDGR